MKHDLQLVKRAKMGDAEAFARLYEGIYKDMYRFAVYTLRNTSDAEDAVAEAVTDAFAGIRKLKSEEAFRSWMFRILSNKCRDKLREYANRSVELSEDIPQPERERGMEECIQVRNLFLNCRMRNG